MANLFQIATATFFVALWTQSAQANDVSVSVNNGQGAFLIGGLPKELRGLNYDLTATPNGYHGLFDPCYNGRTFPACYGDGSQTESNLAYIQESGYNYVRVFLSSDYVDRGFVFPSPKKDDPIPPGENQVDRQWLSDIADFLERAHNHNIRVILTGEFAPLNFPVANFQCINNGVTIDPCSQGENNILFNPNYAQAFGTFYQQILLGLKAADYAAAWPDAYSAIMAIDMWQEGKAMSNYLPLVDHTLTALQIDNGQYDMADFSSRQALIDDLTKNFSISVASAIRAVDQAGPNQILLEMSVVTPQQEGQTGFSGANGPSDCPDTALAPCTFPLRSDILGLYGSVDFRDVHSYQFPGSYNEDVDLQSGGLSPNVANAKPLMMGEFGAERVNNNDPGAVYTDEATAASALQRHMSASCAYGFSGWGLWTWTTQNLSNSEQYWSAIFYDQNGENNTINGAIAPNGALAHICP